jgi:dipeptidyl aminopeptidase/acylaminoacyl peptidase
VLIAGAAVVVAGAAALGAWLLTEDDGEGKPRSRQVVLPPVHRPGQISAEELQGDPQILLVLADRIRASTSASGDLYVVNADGTGLRRVKAWPPYGDAPEGGVYGTYDARWSPDRRLIALDLGVYLDDPGGQVAVVSPSGRGLRRLSEANDAGNLAWSRRGELAYSSGGELWVASPQTGRTRRIRNSGLGFSLMGHGEVEWAPDGKRLVLRTSKGLLVATLAGERKWLTHTARDSGPRWSPNGQAIAFVRVPRCYGEFGCKGSSNVYLFKPGGSRHRRLTEHARATDLLWSPKGRSILLNQESPDGGISEGTVAVVGGDGGHLRRLARDATALAWSPDGTKVLYSHGRGLWLMDADGGRPTRLVVIGHGRRGLTIVAADWGARAS